MKKNYLKISILFIGIWLLPLSFSVANGDGGIDQEWLNDKAKNKVSDSDSMYSIAKKTRNLTNVAIMKGSVFMRIKCPGGWADWQNAPDCLNTARQILKAENTRMITNKIADDLEDHFDYGTVSAKKPGDMTPNEFFIRQKQNANARYLERQRKGIVHLPTNAENTGDRVEVGGRVTPGSTGGSGAQFGDTGSAGDGGPQFRDTGSTGGGGPQFRDTGSAGGGGPQFRDTGSTRGAIDKYNRQRTAAINKAVDQEMEARVKQAEAIIAKAEEKGYRYNPKNNTITGPDGKVVKPSKTPKLTKKQQKKLFKQAQDEIAQIKKKAGLAFDRRYPALPTAQKFKNINQYKWKAPNFKHLVKSLDQQQKGTSSYSPNTHAHRQIATVSHPYVLGENALVTREGNFLEDLPTRPYGKHEIGAASNNIFEMIHRRYIKESISLSH